MNLPTAVDDLSLSRHEPLGSWLAQPYFERPDRRARSGANHALDNFVKEMQQDVHAAAAALRWAFLLFTLSDGSTLEVTDDGSELYKVFLDYQLELSRDHNGAKKSANRIRRNGLSAINLKLTVKIDTAAEPRDTEVATHVTGQGDQRSSGLDRISRSKPDHRPVKTDFQGSGPDTARDSVSGRGPNSASQQPTPSNATLPADGISVTKPNKRSAQKREKKRKASSQKPPVVSPSDASEDDHGPRKIHATTAASTSFHRTKRIVTNPCPPDKLTRISKNNQQARGETETQWHHMDSHSFDFASSLGSKDVRGSGLPLGGRKDERRLNASTQATQSSSHLKKVRKTTSAGTLPARPRKRLRRACTPDGEGDGFDSTQVSKLSFSEEPAVQQIINTGPLLAQGNARKGLKAQKKRTRLEFEAGFVACHEALPADSNELLGPDIRLKRPLPRKVCKRRSVSVTREERTARGVPRGEPSLEYVDQVIRDGATNALAVLREEVGPDVPDWTQIDEQDAEGDEQDEVE
ncbi:hypothetical protein JVU11DRAFT_2683 [Chiua virens]|nr:hypothetical protein JVU11DRAFT_2683 [Chiua virens]